MRVRMTWRTRDGAEMSGPWVDGDDHQTALNGARQAARMVGWPGHSGGWWNYFVDDCVNWMHRNRVMNLFGDGK